MTKLKVKKLSETAVVPKFMTAGAAAMDLTADSMEVEHHDGIWCSDYKYPKKYKYGTGLAFEIPEGYVGLIFPRSSVFKTPQRLSNCVGVIDSDYRGEVSFVFDAFGSDGTPYVKGDRIGQLMLVKLPIIEVEEVTELSDTTRGVGGFGSTGLK